MISAAPPGANGTINRMGLVGKFCAETIVEKNNRLATATNRISIELTVNRYIFRNFIEAIGSEVGYVLSRKVRIVGYIEINFESTYTLLSENEIVQRSILMKTL